MLDVINQLDEEDANQRVPQLEKHCFKTKEIPYCQNDA
jgi:hypothetical protein